MKVEIPTRELVTGEAVPVDKKEGTIENKTELANRYNMVYSSTFVTNGTATEMDTETGIAQMMNEIKEKNSTQQA